MFLKVDSTFEKDNTDCNGADATIVLNTECYVPMTSILTLTQLPVDYLIRVKVRAHNAKGWGDYSELNTGAATIETLPARMSAPTFDISLTSNSQTSIHWIALTGSDTGGQSVIIDMYDL
jgi:hypothetical protein